MKKLIYYFPIIHMSADLGSIASEVTKRAIANLGEKIWAMHKDTIEGFWNSVEKYIESMEVKECKIYQDGMIADGEASEKIVEEAVKQGSKNYQIVSGLMKQGAKLMMTEDFALVKKERDLLVKMSSAKTKRGKIVSYLRYKFSKNALLEKRDEFIAKRINETLCDGESGILFIGAYHDVIPKLSKDIKVEPVKDMGKMRDYQGSILRYLAGDKSRLKRIEELSKYLKSSID